MESHQDEGQITDKCLSLEDIYRYQRDSLSDKDNSKKMIEFFYF